MRGCKFFQCHRISSHRRQCCQCQPPSLHLSISRSLLSPSLHLSISLFLFLSLSLSLSLSTKTPSPFTILQILDFEKGGGRLVRTDGFILPSHAASILERARAAVESGVGTRSRQNTPTSCSALHHLESLNPVLSQDRILRMPSTPRATILGVISPRIRIRVFPCRRNRRGHPCACGGAKRRHSHGEGRDAQTAETEGATTCSSLFSQGASPVYCLRLLGALTSTQTCLPSTRTCFPI